MKRIRWLRPTQEPDNQHTPELIGQVFQSIVGCWYTSPTHLLTSQEDATCSSLTDARLHPGAHQLFWKESCSLLYLTYAGKIFPGQILH